MSSSNADEDTYRKKLAADSLADSLFVISELQSPDRDCSTSIALQELQHSGLSRFETIEYTQIDMMPNNLLKMVLQNTLLKSSWKEPRRGGGLSLL